MAERGAAGGRALLFSAILILGSAALSLGAAELVLRLKNAAQDNYDIEMWRYARELKRPSDIAVLGHEHRPNAAAELQRVVVRTDERGLRGGPVQPVSPGQRRILFLGSSITLGWGVREEETMTELLRAAFARDGRDVQVLNAGVGNYNTERYVTLYFERLADLAPTDIVVNYFVNDAETLEAGGANFLLRNSQLAVTLWIAANRTFGRTGMRSLEEHYRAVYRPDAPGYMAMVASLDRLKAHADARGIRVLVAIVPDVHRLDDYAFGYIHERLGELSRARGFAFVDLYPALAGQDRKSIWALPGDPHPNALGHRLMAEALYSALK